jgi:hypothetical protein
MINFKQTMQDLFLFKKIDAKILVMKGKNVRKNHKNLFG